MIAHPSLKKIVLFSFLAFYIPLLKPVYAAKHTFLQKKEVNIIFEDTLRVAAEEVTKIYPGLKTELEGIFGWKVNFKPTVMLIKDRKRFQRLAGSDLIVAFARPQKNLVVIDYSKMKTDPFSIELILKHELCHLLLHSHIKREKLPRWLGEGIAQWVSGGIAEIMRSQKRSVLDGAILSGKHISIRALAKRFPQDRRSLLLAYEESKSLIEYIIREYDKDGILMVLAHLKDGDEVDEAILKGLLISFDELEERWYNHLKKRITWYTYLINHLYEILFSLAALILIYGFVKVLMKKRAYERYEEEDNGLDI